jgi:hypothetical protein
MISIPRNSVGKLSEEMMRQAPYSERQQHGFRQRRGRADREVARERRALEAARVQPERGDGCSRHEQHREPEAVARAAAPDFEAEDRKHPGEQQVLGEHRGEDQRPVHGAASGRRLPSTRCW